MTNERGLSKALWRAASLAEALIQGLCLNLTRVAAPGAGACCRPAPPAPAHAAVLPAMGATGCGCAHGGAGAGANH